VRPTAYPDGSDVSSSNKRERALAREKYERQQKARAERASAQRRRTQVVAVVAGLAVVAVAVLALVLSSRDDSSTTADGSPTPSATPSASPSSTGKVTCAKAPTPTVKTQQWTQPGGSPLPTDKLTFMKLATNCGDIVIQLDAKAAPQTTQSMAFLAAQGFYTDSDCFRLTTTGIFVLQCGSPTNNGKGGPGYKVPDENLPADGATGYPAGTVAMANSGPGTSGSQFFIIYKDGSNLGPNYTIWGKVVSGLDVVTTVAAAGVQGGSTHDDGKPVQPIVITKATTGDSSSVG
jgi:peptidyl-prolyl cis-trans isomerase B (cyclophilin B)